MPITGRPREFDREAALDEAMRLFWRKGYASSSMTDLCDAMGIRSPSLYAAVGSKEALYLEALDRYVTTIGEGLWRKLERHATARAGVEDLLFTAREMLPASAAAPGGCMSTLAGVGDEWPDAVACVAAEIRKSCLGHLGSRFDAAVADGELSASTDVDRLSRFYLGVFQGMALQARDGATSAELAGLVDMAMMAWPGATDG
jgi:AcrR family transcriptional regulator